MFILFYELHNNNNNSSYYINKATASIFPNSRQLSIREVSYKHELEMPYNKYKE